MRPLYVPVRLAAAVLVVAAAAGCVNVGEDGGRATPSHSAGRRGGEASDGGTAGSGGERGYGGTAGDGKHGHGGRAKRGKSASPSAKPSEAGSASTTPVKSGDTQEPADPAPTQAQPTPTPTPPAPEPPASSPPPPVTDPPSAEPSSSAHEETGPQLVQREPAPEAGSPA
ncbi:hypothetical protein [Streptomyces sp. NPDC058964]|uniref:hypothetical protein n=1 Tax=Streptomyces sp. NPDC058964 TaxID=3346681 RepID=UPI00368FB41D